MIVLFLGLAACSNDGANDSAVTQTAPLDGHWTITNTVNSDPCGISVGWTTADTGGTGFTLSHLDADNFTVGMDEAGEGQQPVVLSCTLHGSSFTCEPAVVESPIDEIDASIQTTEDTAGEFPTWDTAIGWTTLMVDCVGADCAVVTDTLPLPCEVGLDLSAEAD